ncbi:hypothetical protein GE107_08695 [Cohnella sp. CFH 77786]|uniref:hypothetical protein n=1 Tax=Cohnella sp. CFH 77786 TaxID=2662265 RepID=UPI001C60EC14|nr:hypothetical protein [Cohnella sp. CFH 77786]MBW5446137.1 hypothetical protein [Cohnella sp. CFH 77786]
MKYKLGSILFVIFLAISLGVAAYQDGQKNKGRNNEFPAMEDVVSAAIHIGGPPDPNRQPIQMDLNSFMQKLTVAKIIYWLSHAEDMGPPLSQFVTKGGGPDEFVIKTNDGKSIGIFDAVDPISVVVSNGWMFTGVSVSDQVTVTYDNRILRFKSPDLKRWIETDMRQMIEDRAKKQP